MDPDPDPGGQKHTNPTYLADPQHWHTAKPCKPSRDYPALEKSFKFLLFYLVRKFPLLLEPDRERGGREGGRGRGEGAEYCWYGNHFV